MDVELANNIKEKYLKEQYQNMKKIEILDKIEKVVYVTQPSPVILVSTISKDYIENVAPFGMFMNCSTKPYSMVAVAISPKQILTRI